jgi:predicted ATPase
MFWRKLVPIALILAAGSANAESALERGRALLKEHNCNGGCHQSHAEDNDPLTLYLRAGRKSTDRNKLTAQVRYCVSQLNLMIFPEDEPAIVEALDRDFYKFLTK